MIYHKHLLVNAKINNPVKTEQQGVDFLTDLVNKIDMRIIKGPFASYVEKPGNRGLTAIVMIETSHIAFHIWDEGDPGLIQFDLYTCGQLDFDNVIAVFQQHFAVAEYDYVLFDRENGFVIEQQGEGVDNWQHNEYHKGRAIPANMMNPEVGNFYGSKKATL